MKQVDIYTLASTTGGERLDIYTVNLSNFVPPPVGPDALLLEDGFYLLLEDGFKLLLE